MTLLIRYAASLESNKRLYRFFGNVLGELYIKFRKRLAQLARELRSLSHIPLASSIETYLHLDASSNGSNRFWWTAFPREYMRMAAERLVKAIDGGKPLRLGSLYNRTEAVTPYKTIFI
ncbi:hypothetical protein VTI74DRAFT_561 [Chaetomium olivicolor]